MTIGDKKQNIDKAQFKNNCSKQITAKRSYFLNGQKQTGFIQKFPY